MGCHVALEAALTPSGHATQGAGCKGCERGAAEELPRGGGASRQCAQRISSQTPASPAAAARPCGSAARTLDS